MTLLEKFKHQQYRLQYINLCHALNNFKMLKLAI